jgi:hypothetical protein
MNLVSDPRNCPFVGLEPFEVTHAEYFFGRRQDSKIIADHVLSRPVTVLYGPSGVGKSSILNVGLPAVLKETGRWIIASLRDWQDLQGLERRTIDAVLDGLPQRPRRPTNRLRLLPLVAWATSTTRSPVLLILDQFEEYFLYRNPDRMREIETAVGDIVSRKNLPLHLLITLRDDALHELDQLRTFFPGILDTTIKLGHLSDAAVRDAICSPIEVYNRKFRENAEPIRIEDGLVSTLIKELKATESGLGRGRSVVGQERRVIELPYLQLALMKLWEIEGGSAATTLRTSTLTDPRRLGGVRQIARAHVNAVMGSLSPDEQSLCARIFDRLVTGIGSKIAYPTAALASPEISGRNISEDAIKAVLHKLTGREARILKDVVTGGLEGFEIFHDVLGVPVLEWKRSLEEEHEVTLAAQREQEAARKRFLLTVSALSVFITLAAGVLVFVPNAVSYVFSSIRIPVLSYSVVAYSAAAMGSIAVELTAMIRDIAENEGRLPARYRRWVYPVFRAFLALVVAGPMAIVLDARSTVFALYVGACSPVLFDRFAAPTRIPRRRSRK